MVGGSALRAAANEVIKEGKRFAAHFLEVDEADIALADRRLTVALPSELGHGLQGSGAFSANMPTFPNGCHICEVEVDPEVVKVALDRYTVVDDIGTVVNPLLRAIKFRTASLRERDRRCSRTSS